MEHNTRHEAPPDGRLFLCPDIVMPELVMDLIQSLPELQEISHNAQKQLNIELGRICVEYSPRLIGSSKNALSPYGAYHALLNQTVSRGWKEKPENTAAAEDIGMIENLKSDAAAFEDARATIMGFGETVVTNLIPKLHLGMHLIGNHQYELVPGRLGGAEYEWLCGFDEPGSKQIYFNRWDEIKNPGARAAFLNDYVQLMNDLIMEEAK